MTSISRKEWLAKRRELITASDVAAILGFDDRAGRSPLEVFAAKKTGKNLPDNDRILFGREYELGTAAIYAHKTGRAVRDIGSTRLTMHPNIPWLGATLDRVTWPLDADPEIDHGHPLELKYIDDFRKIAEFTDGDCPLWLQIQLQIQIACHGALLGSWAAKIPGSFAYGDLDRNDGFLESTIPLLEDFRRRLREDDPPPVSSPRDLAPIKKLFPLDSGETKQLYDTVLGVVNEWEAAKIDVKAVTDKAERLEAEIRYVLGSATFGILPDGTMVTLKTTEKKGYTVDYPPTSYRTLRRVKI